MKNGVSVSNNVWELVSPIAEGLGLSIWDVQLLKEGPNLILRIFIDRDGGVTIDDCEKMSRAIDKPIEDLDLIKSSYCLEVSSPGVNRLLKRDQHFEKSIGKDVWIKFVRPFDGDQREIKGRLKSVSKEEIVVYLSDRNEFVCKRKDIAFVKLDDFVI